MNGRVQTVTSPIDVSEGDFVLIGMGLILEKISKKKFKDLDSFLRNVELEG